jgi:hypothetical protein
MLAGCAALVALLSVGAASDAARQPASVWNGTPTAPLLSASAPRQGAPACEASLAGFGRAALAVAPVALPAATFAAQQSMPVQQSSSIGLVEAAPVGRTFYLDPDGDDGHSGVSTDKPWRTLKHAIPQLRPADTLLLRGGTYSESEIRIDVAGAENAPITIAAFPGEQPVIDGSYPEFRMSSNAAWELVDPGRQIFRSVKTYPNAGVVYGFLGQRDGEWQLVPYELQGPFGTVNEFYSETAPFYYIGPGVYWDSGDMRIYYRSQHGIYQQDKGPLVPFHPDPRETALYLFPDDEIFDVRDDAAHLVFSGLDIRNQRTAIHVDGGAHHITVRDCRVRGSRYHILVRGGSHDLIFDRLSIAGGFPSWVTWTDVKFPEFARPGHLYQGSAFHLEDNVDRVEISNCSVTGVFDAIGAGDSPTNLRVHHNVFDVADDVLQLGSAGWGIEFDHNTVLRAHSGGPSWNGSGSPPAAMVGTIYIHHNVIDTSTPQRFGRWDPLGLLHPKYQGKLGDGFATGRTFGSHSKEGITGPSPWKIYHNTAIVADDVNNGGVGQTYRSPYVDPAVPHEVYNNIFVQLGDEWILREARTDDGSQIHDGNLYWAPNLLPGTDLLEDVASGIMEEDFASLAQFVGSIGWAATRAHYPPGWESSGLQVDPQLNASHAPHPAGPAATGALDLSGRRWPGAAGETFRGALPPSP